MKSKSLIFLFCLITSQITNGQITPIVTISDRDYTVYETSQYSQNLGIVENQSPQLKLKIYEAHIKARYKVDSGFDSNFFQQTLTQSNYNYLIANRSKSTRFRITYIINEIGNVLSCALQIKSNVVSLTSNEIEAILAAAKLHTFEYINKPQDVNSSYYTTTCDYVL